MENKEETNEQYYPLCPPQPFEHHTPPSSSRNYSAADYDRPSSPPKPSFKPSRELEESIKNQTDVTLRFTKQLLLTFGKNNNMVYSPLSIHVVLSMIVAGTKGHTQEKLLRFLKSKSIDELNDLASNVVPLVFADGSSSGGPRLSFANGPEEVRCEVNSCAVKETNGCIKEIIPEGLVTSYTELILANALYFKGAWDQDFNAPKAQWKNFHLLNGSSIRAPFMTSLKDQYISAFDGFKVLKLPYKQGGDYDRRFSMLVFSSESGFIDGYIPHREVSVGRFFIPKFKISARFDAVDVLKPLGLSLKDGDFTEMVEDMNLRLDKILHKSFIEVNEEGTEAAAVTAALFYGRAMAPRIKMDFVADHPFLFRIREELTRTVMFIGHVLNPIAYEAI
ncbi:putative Serpin family protein [Rosa chinensis]|uniref:Putative Serpin family protein n=1 Tax=Rosa chinensis TaxID=74649 RepID=A0A2P6P9T4_ROSCH|nr:putative Serpin family protein [Rosa chinensis]